MVEARRYPKPYSIIVHHGTHYNLQSLPKESSFIESRHCGDVPRLNSMNMCHYACGYYCFRFSL